MPSSFSLPVFAFILLVTLLLKAPATADTLTWNNTGGTNYNAAGSWTNLTSPLSPRVPTFTDLADFSNEGNLDPMLTSSSEVMGLRFGTLGGISNGYVLSSSGLAQLSIGTGGIAASNTVGSNAITAALNLNMSQTITQASGGTLNITGPATIGSDGGMSLTIGSNSSGNGSLNFAPSTVVLSSDLALTTHVNVTLPGVALFNAVGTNGGITKNGAATLTITGASGYNNGTVVNAGTLLITNASGSATGTGAVVVNNGGTLGGTGRINAGANTITVHGGLSSGAATAPGNVGTLALQSSAGVGAVTLSSTSTLFFDIISAGSKDLIALGGSALTLGGGGLQFNLGAGFDYSGTYTIFSGVSGLSGSGFGSVTGHDNTMYTPSFALNGTNYDVSFAPVPEPSTWIAGALVVSALAWSQRRRFAQAWAKR